MPTKAPGPLDHSDMSINERYYTSYPQVPPSYRTMPAHGQANENDSLLPSSANWPPSRDARPSRSSVIAKNALSIILTLILVLGLESGYIYATMNATKTIYDPLERARIRRDWQREYAAYTQNITRLSIERDRLHSDWTTEHDKLQALRENAAREHEKWEEERRQWQEERREREREERERQKKLIQWGQVRRDEEPCVSYGVARYQAHLEYTPPGWDKYTACKETPVRFHGKDVFPTECRHTGSEMVGIWIIDFDEPACKPWWRDTKDHGCTSRQSGIHRYEAHLEGYLEPNEFKTNWPEMCDTTPHTMFGHTYKSPMECVFWPRIGVYGFWDVPDEHCR